MTTIAAIATGSAAGGVGIIRLSGPSALAAARRVARLPERPTPRHAYFVRFADPSGAVLDEGLALYFAGPRSFTGEDVVELHAHGAPRLLSLLLAELLKHETVRLATPGEFTRRALLSGRLDLTRAEAVADLIAAESEAQVRAAAAQLAGELAARLEALHAPLLALQADVEGVLDFPDEAEGAEADAARRLDALLADARRLLADARRGALVRRGARVVLFGPVNAGKSTLFNALVGAERALVDAEPGTTRDTLEARLELAGLAVTLVDTAGLREGAGRIEALGIARTREALRGADVAVLVLPPDATAEQRAAWLAEAPDALVLWGKADLAAHDGLAVSGLTGAGLDALRQALLVRLAPSSGAVLSTSERHVRVLAEIEESLGRARLACDVATLEVVAGELSLALHALAELTGADVSSELLDAIFQRFCIGK
ncbi:MAG: tRNA uridine-5-carboxymethylaminomethyl(34) synthesis GTPase MnmE [Myxococcota bacterium]